MQPPSPDRTFTFNKPRLKAIPSPLAGDTIYRDEGCPGLMLRVSPTRKTFFIRRRVSGKIRQLKLGSFPTLAPDQARKLASAAIVKMAEGVDPSEQRRKAREVAATASRRNPTLKTIWTDFKDSYLNEAVKPYTLIGHEHAFSHIEKAFGDRRLSTITFPEILALHRSMKATPVAANKSMELLERLYSVAKSQYEFTGSGFRTISKKGRRQRPWKNVSGNAIVLYSTAPRSRTMTDDEDERFRVALTEMRTAGLTPDPDDAGLTPEQKRERLNQATIIPDYFWTLYLTGVRKRAAVSMGWDQLEWVGGKIIWRIPPTHPGMKGKGQTIVLDGFLAGILRQRRELVSRDALWVFPTRDVSAKAKSGHLENPVKAWNLLLDSAKIKGLCFHDLRRCLASRLQKSGANQWTIQSCLNHSPGSTVTAEVYARVDGEQIEAAMQRANEGTAGRIGETETAA